MKVFRHHHYNHHHAISFPLSNKYSYEEFLTSTCDTALRRILPFLKKGLSSSSSGNHIHGDPDHYFQYYSLEEYALAMEYTWKDPPIVLGDLIEFVRERRFVLTARGMAGLDNSQV
jgi:hypothetical protein